MSDDVDVMRFGLRTTGEIVVMVGEEAEAASWPELLALAPRASAAKWAEISNELAFDGGFEVISDPEAYRRAYLSQVEAEDPARAWQEGVIRRRDFGMPDFAEIHVPTLKGDHLVYFASDATTGLPYRAEAHLTPGSAAPRYEPLELTPMPEPAPMVPPRPRNPERAAAEPEAAEPVED